MTKLDLKHPNWNNKEHRDFYYNMSEKTLGRKFTEDEERFFRTMYHFEEVKYGLD